MIINPRPLTDSLTLPSWRGPFRFTLKNGIPVLLARREKSPVIELRLIIEGGFAADPDRLSGLASLATGMFSEGLLQTEGSQLGSALESRGALLHSEVMPDSAIIGMSTLEANLADALQIFVDALTDPEFKDEDFELVRANRLALIASERS